MHLVGRQLSALHVCVASPVANPVLRLAVTSSVRRGTGKEPQAPPSEYGSDSEALAAQLASLGLPMSFGKQVGRGWISHHRTASCAG